MFTNKTLARLGYFIAMMIIGHNSGDIKADLFWGQLFYFKMGYSN